MELITPERVVNRWKMKSAAMLSNSLDAKSSPLTLQAATQTVSTRPPRVGELVLVRSRRWLVDEVIEAKSSKRNLYHSAWLRY